ncbi:hypothetical protein JNUCC0626_30030 [Lentzea sp. JNUCC 0626]|uniref:hypothetical protein n=1 Tax=Lentzea sp. JNUCC 0626 TaxID=3367513 RepID=UPI0037498724
MVWSRTLIGALAGAFAGVAGYLCWWWVLPEACVGAVGRTCDRWSLSGLLFLPALWAVVGGLVHRWVLRLLKLPRTALVPSLGCALWPVIWLAGGYAGLWSHGEVAVIFVPVVAFSLAAAVGAGYGGRRDRAEHRGQDG